MDDDKDKFLEDLPSMPIEYLVSKWVLERTPYIFFDDHQNYINWKLQLSRKICVDSTAIMITGSAATGFSLNPNKNFKGFDNSSDVDIAIISNHYFNSAWYYLRNLGTKRYGLRASQIAALKDHVNRLIYWGTIATDKILALFPFGTEWQKKLDEMSKIPPTENREINIRIYKDAESLRAYMVNNFNKLKYKIIER